MPKLFSFRPGARISGDPTIVGEHLETLREHHGGDLRPDDVVDDARQDNSPLHDQFEWDDTKAAHEHRLWRARNIIGSVVVKFEESPEDQDPVRAFVNIKREDEERSRSYVSMRDALIDPELRRQVLMDALRDLERVRSKYQDLHELASIFAAIDDAKEGL